MGRGTGELFVNLLYNSSKGDNLRHNLNHLHSSLSHLHELHVVLGRGGGGLVPVLLAVPAEPGLRVLGVVLLLAAGLDPVLEAARLHDLQLLHRLGGARQRGGGGGGGVVVGVRGAVHLTGDCHNQQLLTDRDGDMRYDVKRILDLNSRKYPTPLSHDRHGSPRYAAHTATC